MKIYQILSIGFLSVIYMSCVSCTDDNNMEPNPDPDPDTTVVVDDPNALYPSYTKLVMAGYQGWFAAEGDESQRGWYHYENGSCGGFHPGCSTIDMWPDMTEYTTKYETSFTYDDGTSAYLYSPYDAETVDLHFKWMKEYGLDGVHMQRFVGEIKPSNARGKRHFNQVLDNALIAAKKYERAISVMYDLSGSSSFDVAYLEDDWNELVAKHDLLNSAKHPSYLRHNGKPLVTIWGVGFNDHRAYSIADVDALVTSLKSSNQVSVMLGVPYYWRTFGSDTENDPAFHELIRKADIIMPWAVGRYDINGYNPNNVAEDVKWCKTNDVDYVPLVFPGFSWGNMNNDPNIYHSIPRLEGDFLWRQIAGAKTEGAKALYVAMFDEIDEGTAIYKVSNEGNTPLNGESGLKFIGVEDNLPTDHYLWLVGQGAKWFHGEGTFGINKPNR